MLGYVISKLFSLDALNTTDDVFRGLRLVLRRVFDLHI